MLKCHNKQKHGSINADRQEDGDDRESLTKENGEEVNRGSTSDYLSCNVAVDKVKTLSRLEDLKIRKEVKPHSGVLKPKKTAQGLNHRSHLFDSSSEEDEGDKVIETSSSKSIQSFREDRIQNETVNGVDLSSFFESSENGRKGVFAISKSPDDVDDFFEDSDKDDENVSDDIFDDSDLLLDDGKPDEAKLVEENLTIEESPVATHVIPQELGDKSLKLDNPNEMGDTNHVKPKNPTKTEIPEKPKMKERKKKLKSVDPKFIEPSQGSSRHFAPKTFPQSLSAEIENPL